MNKKPFEKIDPLLESWAHEKGLIVTKNYKDFEVRHISIIDNEGDKYELFLTSPSLINRLTISVGLIERASRRTPIKEKKELQKTWKTSVRNLKSELENAYQTIEKWILNEGHSRTFV